MLKLRSCPRCRGDVLIEKDMDGWYEQCLQCGYMRDLAVEIKITPEELGHRRKHKKLVHVRRQE